MTFEDEWARLRTDASARQEAARSQTRINHLAAGPGGDQPDFSSSAVKKKAAVSALQNHVEPDTRAAGGCVDASADAATKGFKGWETAAGITDALEGWGAAVTALQNRLAGEKAALGSAGNLFRNTDHDTARLLAPPALPGPYTPNGPAGVPYPSRVSDY
ncbi:hypothetical protein AB0I49_35380 [Streptomyces sp. NPDC050617]|uniref:hypothetical protein n=1 Tax=Streptomyces sp. NPDC050617 TaxID=3154628 RepID=UPI0034281B0C